MNDQLYERDSFTLPRCVGAWYSLPSLGPPHGRSPGTIAMSKKQTGTNNVFDESLKDFVEGRRARARLPKNHRKLAASLRKKLKVPEPEVGRLPDALFPVSTTQPEATRWRLEVTVRSIHGQTGLHALGNFCGRRRHGRAWGKPCFLPCFGHHVHPWIHLASGSGYTRTGYTLGISPLCQPLLALLSGYGLSRRFSDGELFLGPEPKAALLRWTLRRGTHGGGVGVLGCRRRR